MIYWFYIQSKTTENFDTQPKPQEYMLNLSSTKFNVDGKPKELISAEYWEFDPTHGCSDLTKPFVTVYKPNGDIWYISANKALAWHRTISDQISKIDLLAGVNIERPALNNATPIKIETSALQYTPDQEKISTDEFVSMQQPGLTISGYGMIGYLDRNWIELHEKITTVYTPK